MLTALVLHEKCTRFQATEARNFFVSVITIAISN